mgnify:CR=1 FL=1
MLYGSSMFGSQPCTEKYNSPYPTESNSWVPNIGITFGTFDLLHAGHVAMLESCKQQCDSLIVGLQSDPTIDRPEIKNKPIQSLFERWVQLSGLQYVDKIIPYDTEDDLAQILSMVHVRKRFVGEEYKGFELYAEDVCKARNIEIIYIERKHGFSSSELRKRVFHHESHG